MSRDTSSGRPGQRSRVRVIVLQQGLGPLDYATPGGRRLVPGQIVQVPLGPRLITGVAIGRAHVCTPVTHAHLVCRRLLEKKTQSHAIVAHLSHLRSLPPINVTAPSPDS